MAHWLDYLIDIVKNAWTEPTAVGADNTAVTATHTGQAQRHHVVCKVDASYDDSAATGVLTVLHGTTNIGRKHIHGAGAIDFGVFGFENSTVNDDVSASLSAVAATGGVITMTGYSTGPR